MELFEKRYYKLTKTLLSFLGQWPEQTLWTRRLIQISVVLLMLSIAIPEVIKLIKVWDDLDTVVECVPPLGLHLVVCIKSITTVRHVDDMKKLLVRMQRDWKSRLGGDGSDVLKRFAERSRFIAVGYAYYMFVGGSLYACSPLLSFILDFIKPLNESRPREFLFRTEYFVEQEDYYFLVFIHAYVTTFSSMATVVAFDILYSAYIHYTCAIFVELGEEIENVVTSKGESIDVSKINDHTYHQIVQCVKKHKEAIIFCDLLGSTYGQYFFLAIGLNIFLISFTGVQAVMRLDDPNLVIRHGIYVIGQILHSFFGCWHGQLLINLSEQINVAAYKCAWYNSSFRSRRLLALVMTRSAQPCQISGGNLFLISLPTFTTIIKTAMSYFTVLRSLQ